MMNCHTFSISPVLSLLWTSILYINTIRYDTRSYNFLQLKSVKTEKKTTSRKQICSEITDFFVSFAKLARVCLAIISLTAFSHGLFKHKTIVIVVATIATVKYFTWKYQTLLHFLYSCSHLLAFLLSSQFYWHIRLKPTAYFLSRPVQLSGFVPGFSLFRDAAYCLSLSTNDSTNDVTRHQYPYIYIHTYIHRPTHLYSAKTRENESEALTQDD